MSCTSSSESYRQVRAGSETAAEGGRESLAETMPLSQHQAGRLIPSTPEGFSLRKPGTDLKFLV